MTFREDESRARDRRLAENLAWLRRFALGCSSSTPTQDELSHETPPRRLDSTFLRKSCSESQLRAYPRTLVDGG